MVRRIIWSQRSHVDRKEIFSYWNHRNGSKNIPKLRKQIKEMAVKLAQNPFLGSPLTSVNVRKKLMGDYLIVYELDDRNIVILSIFDTRQYPDKLNTIK
jgi:toxin YoeB